ncbi:MAG: histidine kinase [Bacteroidales bacterium]|nr:histidine kinase [Bacteroidales bacterium]
MGKELYLRILVVFLISGMIFLAILLFFFPDIDRYGFHVLKQEPCDWNIVDYHDLNNDGVFEKIACNTSPPIPYFLVTSGKGILDQFNFSGGMCEIDHASYGDYNHNGLKEIYVFTWSDDSIFLNVVEPYKTDYQYSAGKFVDKYLMYKGQYTHSVHPCGSFDLNDDGHKEFVFSVFTGYAVFPRRMYAYDPVKDTIIKSPQAGTGIFKPYAFDLNRDGKVEFFGDVSALGNCRNDVPFRDDHSYLMIFDHSMNFLFDPVEIGSFPSSLVIRPFIPHHRPYLATLHKSMGVEAIPSELMLFDIAGKMIRSVPLNNDEIGEMYLVSANEHTRDELYLIHPDGLVEELDTNLLVVSKKRIRGILTGLHTTLDINLDGLQEYIFRGIHPQELIVTDHQLNRMGKLAVPDNKKVKNISVEGKPDAGPVIYLQCSDQSLYYSSKLNPLYSWRYLVFCLIFIAIFLILFGTQQLQLYILSQCFARERRIAELQIRSVKNQIDPHFTLNILNSIGNLFLKNDAGKADYIFGKYARMLRNTITSSDKITVTLEEELEFVNDYLGLERYRMQERFDYRIETGPGVDKSLKIPKMLIHTFAENAVKHGLKPLKAGGLLSINVQKEDNICSIEIADNGIGRAGAAEMSGMSTGKGLQIIDEILKLYRKLEKSGIVYEVTDLVDETGKAAGTKVKITIPFSKT